MKKLLSSGLILILIISLLAPLGTAALAAEGEVVEVQFFHTTWVPAMLEMLEGVIADFEAENPGIKIVETRTNWADAPSQMMTSIMGGTPPDLTMCNPAMLAQFRGIGAFEDLTDRIPAEFIDSLLPSARAIITTPEGTYDGMPQEGSTYTLFYRTDLFEAAGLDPEKPPRTWDELLEIGKKLTLDTDGDGKVDQYAYGWPVSAENANNYWINWLQQAGSGVSVYEDGGWVSKLDGPEALTATKFMVDLVQTHKITPPNVVEYDWEGAANAFVSGEIAMMHNGAWVVGSVQTKGPELEGKWNTITLFEGPGGKAFRGHPNTFHILKASDHKEEAWKFLEYLYNTPSKVDEGLTVIGSFCKAAGGMLFTTDYVEFARGVYSPLQQPFLDALDNCRVAPMDPQWQTLNNMFVMSTVQQMLMGEVTPEDGLAMLHKNLEKLHGR